MFRMMFKAILCYVKRPKSIEKISRHFLTSLMMEEEIGFLEDSDVKRLISEPAGKIENGYVVRNPNDLRNILKLLGLNESFLEDKIVMELLLKRVK